MTKDKMPNAKIKMTNGKWWTNDKPLNNKPLDVSLLSCEMTKDKMPNAKIKMTSWQMIDKCQGSK